MEEGCPGICVKGSYCPEGSRFGARVAGLPLPKHRALADRSLPLQRTGVRSTTTARRLRLPSGVPSVPHLSRSKSQLGSALLLGVALAGRYGPATWAQKLSDCALGTDCVVRCRQLPASFHLIRFVCEQRRSRSHSINLVSLSFGFVPQGGLTPVRFWLDRSGCQLAIHIVRLSLLRQRWERATGDFNSVDPDPDPCCRDAASMLALLCMVPRRILSQLLCGGFLRSCMLNSRPFSLTNNLVEITIRLLMVPLSAHRPRMTGAFLQTTQIQMRAWRMRAGAFCSASFFALLAMHSQPTTTVCCAEWAGRWICGALVAFASSRDL